MKLHRTLALAAGVLAAGCAGIQAAWAASRSAPATISGGTFTPGQPPAEQYGPGAGYACPTGGLMAQLQGDLADLAKEEKTEPPRSDARLCAAADTFLGWKDKALPPDSVAAFTAWYLGAPAPTLRILMSSVELEDTRASDVQLEAVRKMAERLLQPVSQFASGAAAPRWGVASERTKLGRKVMNRFVLALQDATFELQPFPRKLPLGGQARLAGQLAPGYEKAVVLVGDPSGKLETVPAAAGRDFAAEVRCGDKPGTLLVEIRATRDRAASSLARFPVACGVEPARSTPLPEAGGPSDLGAAEQRALDGMNAARAAAGLPPLAPDPALTKVARALSEAQAQATGPAQLDVTGELRKAEVVSPLVLVNPAAALSPAEALWRLLTSPAPRADLLNPQATHAGVGIVSQRQGKDEAAFTGYYVTQVMVRELPVIELEPMRAQIRTAVDARRKGARADPVTSDPLLEEVAQKYAAALAEGKGKPPEQTLNDVLAPVYKPMKVVSLTAGVKLDPLEVVEEPGVVASAKVAGVGAAQGFNPALGKNAVYVVILVGTRK